MERNGVSENGRAPSGKRLHILRNLHYFRGKKHNYGNYGRSPFICMGKQKQNQRVSRNGSKRNVEWGKLWCTMDKHFRGRPFLDNSPCLMGDEKEPSSKGHKLRFWNPGIQAQTAAERDNMWLFVSQNSTDCLKNSLGPQWVMGKQRKATESRSPVAHPQWIHIFQFQRGIAGMGCILKNGFSPRL